MLSLPDMPLEVLEAICRPLQLMDRLALTSCCRKLLARPDVAGSAQLWGSLGSTIILKSSEEPPPAAAGFFARRIAGLRTLDVELGEFEEPAAANLTALLGALGGSGLVNLEIHGPEGLGEDPGAALQPISRLTALTRLKLFRGLEAIPVHLSVLQSLVHLDLGNNKELGHSGDPAAFESLASLLALTRLDLTRCGLSELPPQLSLLTRLQVLLLIDNPWLGEGGEAGFEGLRCLPALRTLDLSNCGLDAVPRQLGALSALERLDLGWNQALGRNDPAEAFPVLCHLTGLTRLSLHFCGLRQVPPQLASLTALASLYLGGHTIGRPADDGDGCHAFLPLQRLTALTCLDLSRNYFSWSGTLLVVPPQVAALTGLLQLDLSWNTALGEAGEAAFQPLLSRSALTQLYLKSAGLRSLPPQLSGLRALRVLDVSRNEALGQQGDPEMWRPLSRLAALERLNVNECSLRSPAPPALLELAQRGVDVEGLPGV